MPGEDSTADRQTHNESSYASTLPGGQRLWDFCLVSTHLLINQPKCTSSHNAYRQWKCFWKSNHIEMQIMYLVSLLLKTLQWLRSWWMLVSSHMGSAHGYHLLSCSPLLSQLPSPAQPHALHSELFMLPRTCLALSSFKAFCFHGKTSAYRTFIHSFAGQPLIQEGSPAPLSLDSVEAEWHLCCVTDRTLCSCPSLGGLLHSGRPVSVIPAPGTLPGKQQLLKEWLLNT